MPKKAKKAPPKQKSQGSAQSAALAVQFTRRLSDRRTMKHGVTRAESEALHDGLGDDQLNLPFPLWDDVFFDEQELLGAAASLVEPGGCLVYATCSLLGEENDHPAPEGFVEQERRWLWPHHDGTDGFFYAIWRRAAG